MDLITTQDNAAANLPQLEVEIKFYLGQTAQNIIEVGKRLIQAKALVPHGGWQAWLERNFSLSQQTATNFMNCANRFGKIQINLDFKPTQMIALLSLPDEEETATMHFTGLFKTNLADEIFRLTTVRFLR